VAPISLEKTDTGLVVKRPSDEPSVRALHGTTRALIQNMVWASARASASPVVRYRRRYQLLPEMRRSW